MSLASKKPISYLITRGEATSDNFVAAKRQILDIITLAIEEKVSMIQLREKRLSARLLCDLTEAAIAITRGRSTKILVNDRADIAAACGADGVQLTGTSMPVNVVRQFARSNFLIGVSAHSIEDVDVAMAEGADLIVLAPVFVTPGKGEPIGLERFAEMINISSPFPILALGGVDESNIADVLTAGASGFAAIRAMNEPDKLKQLMRTLRSQ